MRPSWVEVDLAAIRHNVSALVSLAAPAEVCAVVKADGYGHGDVPVAESAIEAGATWLAVATPGEGMRLREAGIEAPILLLSECPVGDIQSLAGVGLTFSVYTPDFVEALATGGYRGPVHLKVDTGMHRVGALPGSASTVGAAIRAANGIELAGVWTHFPVAEDDAAFTDGQLKRFEDFVLSLGDVSPIRHAANSAGTILFPESRLDMVRPGLAVYGLHPSDATRPLIDLRPAMRVVSEVVHVKPLPAGARPSYGRTRPLPADTDVAVVPVGYADGVPRRLGPAGGAVLIGGKRRPLAGNVTMDQIMVDMGGDPARVGDEVVLIGNQGDDEITVDEWAGWLDTISWEVVCGFGPRLPRRYRR